MREDTHDKHLYPVSVLFALAIADQAFEGIRTAEDFTRIRFKQNKPTTVLRVREGIKNVPILRQLDRSRVVLSTKILPARKFANIMIDLGYCVGYTRKFSPYAVRRGHGNTIDRK
jgi:hypothetical protein